MRKSPRLLAALWLLSLPAATHAAPVINELMFHPQGVPENPALEWIEIYNPSATETVDLTGWQFTKGVSFTIPAGTMLAPGGYLVVAANVAAFQAGHPGFSSALIGGWTGRLSGSGERVELADALGAAVSSVEYADEGDWATRVRGELDLGHRGWKWESRADGGGSSLELRNPVLGTGNGQNWGSSTADGGTPGAANSLASTNIAPLIKDVKHRPELPRSTDPIVISTDLEDEGPGATATLRWRVDGAATFASLPMTDTDADGDVEATIPAQADQTVLEWHISATDGANTRTWPAPARTSNPGVTPVTFGQVTNALVQVDDSYNPAEDFTLPGNQPIYRLIMTAAERNELAQIGSNSAEAQSLATMNGTFLSHDGTGIQTVYNAGFRNRGLSSALGPPNNFHVNFRSDDLWNGRSSFQLNAQFPHSQALGNSLFARAGIPPQAAAIVRLRVNGVNVATSGSLMYGRYARLEGRGGEWAKTHYPNDPDGNFYRLDDHEPGPAGTPPGNLGSGEFRYEGTDPAAYSDTFIKETNKEENDYTDLIDLTRIVSAPATGGTAGQPAIPDSAYPAAVGAVLDLDEFYRFIATDALIGNQEGGPQSGRADDVSLYAGVLDSRFRLIPHDLDDVFDIGNGAGNPVTRSIFSYDELSGGLEGLTRLFNHPQLVPRYYAALLEGMNTWFTSAKVDPIVDQIMAGWVPAATIASVKGFVAARRANVLGQIQQNYSLSLSGTTTSTDGYPQTNDGGATLSGTFNVARTYSITVNGAAVQANYRSQGGNTAGTWRLALPSGGGGVLNPGLNKVVVNFWDGIGGTGNVLRQLTTDIFYNVPGAGTTVGGTLSAGSLRILAPSTFIAGKPFLVRVDQLDAAGNLDRAAWTTTVSLSSNVVSIALPDVTLYNGMGSALVTAGGGGGGAAQVFFRYGAGGNGTAGSGTPGSTWRSLTNLTNATIGNVPATWKNEGFDDSTWTPVATQTGYGDNDENTPFTRVDYNPAAAGTQSGPSYLFRSTFTIADVGALASVTGEVKFDDSVAVYVNGTQVYRHSDLTANAPLTEYTETTTGTTRENATASLNVPLGLLHNGVNTIAVEVHQHDAGSSDVTFDLRLQADFPSADPGNFVLTASGAGFVATKALTSLGATPAMTNVSGTLPAGTTTWSGVMHVTGDVTVPAGATLQIAAGTHVLFDGNNTPGSTSGADLIVNGTLLSQGTAAQPVAISAFNAADRWGQILFSNAQPSTLAYTLLNHAGHSPGVGHTGKGPMIRLTGSNLTLADSAMADGPAKAIYSSGTCDLVIRRSLIERMITGPEVEDGISLIMEDSNLQFILPHYRESNDATPDDEDCLYVHNSAGRPVEVRRTVLARCGDDVFDCLGGPILIEDSILREAWDKGMSLLDNDLVIRRTQIIDCDKAIVPKSRTATTRTINVDQVTIVAADHDQTQAPWGYSVPPSNPDADTPSTGLYTQNKSGQSNGGATIAITATNSIIIAKEPVKIDAPYAPANTVVTTSDLLLDTGAAFSWPGTGNVSVDPLFVNAAAGDFHLTANSPAIDAGTPAGTDLGALPFDAGTGGGGGTVNWTPAGSPYFVSANTTVPAGSTLTIQAGTRVQFAANARLTVNGNVQVLGTAARHVVFSHVPGTVAAGDSDPIKNGTQTGPAKWGGLRIVDSMGVENVVRYADFINAQGTSPSGSENYGSLGFIRSWGLVEHCTWAGTHLRMCYGRNVKLTVRHCVFPDMFIFDPVLNRIENPTDFVGAADNNQEPLKVEYPTTDPEVTGNPAFTNGQPTNGFFRVYYNDFNGNRGHNDLFDADSGRWNVPGQFVLDCRYNYFHGISGDEHIDLGGDAYIASNIFERATKDQWTSDTGYSNAISSGDRGTGTTIVVARNVFFALDHAINLKASTATLFEHNTVANFNPDYVYTFFTPPQNVKTAPVNFFVPEDGPSPTFGDGAYLGFNLISNVPRLFSGADARKVGGNVVNDVTSKIEFYYNQLDRILDPSVGPNHPGGIFGGTYGVNVPGAPGFVDPAGKDYSLLPSSLAAGSAPGGLDYGATVDEWAYILGGPGPVSNATTADFIIGGPGIVAYKWRIDGGAYSAPIQIGDGGVFPRGATPAVRQATLNLTGLTNGAHTLEVLGQDMAGNWQDDDPARAGEGLPQAAPTTRIWTVDTAAPLIRINEVLARSATVPDTIELYNAGVNPVNIGGWSLSDAGGTSFNFAANTVIPPGGYLLADAAATGIQLDKDGDAVVLQNGATVIDSVTFGPQVTDLTIGRLGADGAWMLCQPTLGAVNVRQRTAAPDRLEISEWFANGNARYDDDWLEVHNLAAFPVPLTGVILTDNAPGDPAASVLPALSFIGADGYVQLWADGKPERGATHLSFKLEAQQEEIVLSDPSGNELDFILFFPQVTDYSQGRDGSGNYVFYELPTGGFANGTGDPGYANALALIRGLRITGIMFNPVGGTDYEYVELRNAGATPLELQGVEFVNGIGFLFSQRVLNPGEEILVVKNLALFRARYGNGPSVAGVFTGSLDNAGEQLELQLPPPFDANILTFIYKDSWFASTDGGGRSLVVANPLIAAGLWGDRDTWMASMQLGGNPGGATLRNDTISGLSAILGVNDLTSDTDRDGVITLAELSLGMNPFDPNAGEGAAGVPTFSVNAGGRGELHFFVPVNPAAAQTHGLEQAVYEVQARDLTGAWATVATKTLAAAWTGPGAVTLGAPAGGFVPVTAEDPAAAGDARLMRLRITFAP